MGRKNFFLVGWYMVIVMKMYMAIEGYSVACIGCFRKYSYVLPIGEGKVFFETNLPNSIVYANVNGVE